MVAETYVDNNAENVITSVFSNPTGPTGSRTYAGDTCTNGLCIPAKFSEVLSQDSLTQEHWKVDAIWADGASTHRSLFGEDMNLELGSVKPGKYIIEFMRYANVDNNNNTCDLDGDGGYDAGEGGGGDWTEWPLCDLDSREFRITAIGFAGNNGEARVMLQSIYVVPAP